MSHRLHPHPPSIQYDQVFVLPRSRDHFLMFRIHWISIRTTLVILEAEISSRTRRTKGKAWVTYNASVLIKKFCICATRFERFFIRSFTVALHTDKNITFRSNANYPRSTLGYVLIASTWAKICPRNVRSTPPFLASKFPRLKGESYKIK